MIKSNVWYSLSIFSLLSFTAHAQYAGDIFRYSEIDQTGTARFQGLGGNHAALGGDASAIFTNPAGLGFYNKSEFSISPAVTAFNTKTSYIDGTMSDSKTNFNIPQASLVFTSQPSFQRKWKRTSLGISFSRQQSFQGQYSFGGRNNKSAYLDKVVEDANAAKTTESQMQGDFDSSIPIAYSIPAAYYQMYLINPTGSATSPTWQALDGQSVVDQYGTYNATGANTAWNISYGGNYNDKFYLGGSIGFTRLRYEYDRVLQDNYVNSPELIYIDQYEHLKVSGNGFNATLGMIYKVNPAFQFGLTMSTPTFTAVKESFDQDVDAAYVDGKVSDGQGNLITPQYTNLGIATNEFTYSFTSPFRTSLGATFFAKTNGFLTATIEYVGYGGMRARTSYLDNNGNSEFKTSTDTEIKDTYKGVVNARVGGEYRVGLFRGRLGFGYLPNAYKFDDGINRDKLLFSAGLGIRNNKYFADVAGTYTTFKSAYTPYYLNNPQNYSSVAITNNTINVMLTVGVFFGR